MAFLFTVAYLQVSHKLVLVRPKHIIREAYGKGRKPEDGSWGLFLTGHTLVSFVKAATQLPSPDYKLFL